MSTAEGGGNVITRNMLLYLDGANPRSYVGSGTNVVDLTGYNNIGSLENGVSFNSNNGGTFVFDGVDEKINFGTTLSSANLTYPFSIDFWIKVNPTGNTTTTRGIFATSNSEVFAYFGISIQLGNAFNGSGNYKVFLNVGNGLSPGPTGRRSLNSDSEVLIGDVWTHVVGIFNTGPTFKIYINGSEVSGTVSGTGGVLNWGTNAKTELGPSNAFNNVLNGTVSNLKFYNTLLTPEEVLQNYNALKSRFGL